MSLEMYRREKERHDSWERAVKNVRKLDKIEFMPLPEHPNRTFLTWSPELMDAVRDAINELLPKVVEVVTKKSRERLVRSARSARSDVNELIELADAPIEDPEN